MELEALRTQCATRESAHETAAMHPALHVHAPSLARHAPCMKLLAWPQTMIITALPCLHSHAATPLCSPLRTTHTESAPPCCAPRPSHDTHRNLAGLGARGRARRADASERKTTKFANTRLRIGCSADRTPVTALRSRKTKPRVPPAQARSDREYSRCSMRITCR